MASGGVTDVERAHLARAAGFPENQIAMAVAVSIAENQAGDPAVTHVNSNGSTDVGLWQINTVNGYGIEPMKDPTANAKAAFNIWNARKSWTPWSTYKSGRAMAFFQRGQFAARDKSVPNPGGGPTVSIDDNSSLQNIVDFFKFISDPHNWQRVGMFALGVILLMVGLFKLGNMGPVVKKAAKTAAVVAAVVPK